MKICSFLGHWSVFDENLPEKLTESIEEIITCDDSFIFYINSESPFSAYCSQAVRKIRGKYAGIDIKIILTAILAKEYKRFHSDIETRIFTPNDYFDDIVLPPTVSEESEWYVNSRRAKKWVIQQSDFLFCYLYEDYISDESYLMKQAEKEKQKGKLKVIDLTSDTTRAVFNANIDRLPDEMKRVYVRFRKGEKPKDIAEEMGISDYMVRQIYNKACRKLRNFVHEIGEY